MRKILWIGLVSILTFSCASPQDRVNEDETWELVKRRWENSVWLDEVKKGFEAYEKRDVKLAHFHLSKAREAGCGDPLVVYRLALVLDRNQESQRAKELYLETAPLLSSEYPKHPYTIQVWHNLGHIEYRSGEYQRALEYYQKAWALTSQAEPELAFSLGMALKRLNDYQEALRWFEKADQEDFRTDFYRAEIYFELGEVDQAIEKMEKALMLNPQSARALGSLGHFWYALSESQEEAEDFPASLKSITRSCSYYQKSISQGGTNYQVYLEASESRIQDLKRIISISETNQILRLDAETSAR